MFLPNMVIILYSIGDNTVNFQATFVFFLFLKNLHPKTCLERKREREGDWREEEREQGREWKR